MMVASRRTQMQTHNSFDAWHYGYNNRDELISARKYSGANPYPGTQFNFTYDTIGNRVSEVREQRSTNYTALPGNRLGSRSVSPRGVDVLGESDAPTVTVNGWATERLGSVFFTALPVAGTVATVQDILVRAEKMVNGQLQVTEDASQHFVPPQLESFTYDADGNMLTDGRWQYTWDAENRLIAMETLASLSALEKKQRTFSYDALGRRVSKRIYTWVPHWGTFTLTDEIQYFWDGWDLVREVHNNGTVRRFTWNPADPRGHRTLLAMTVTNPQGAITTYHAVTDANGNVTRLFDTIGDIAARYEYGPFGEMLRATGHAAEQCPIRYSSEYYDPETELYYYGHRYYSPRLGRWLSKDPIEEHGGINLYGFTNNNPINFYDILGENIYLMQGNDGKNPVNNELHMAICVDQWDECCKNKTGKVCFSFGWESPTALAFGFPTTWLGWSNNSYYLYNAFLDSTRIFHRGKIYSPLPVPNAAVIKTKRTRCDQDKKWLDWMKAARLGLSDVYTISWLNCRKYAQQEFEDAPGFE